MRLIILALVSVLAGCENERFDQAYDRGYSDGYAAGYNTTCKIRATLIAGDWDIQGYKSGYNDGYTHGARQCKTDRPQFK